MKHSGMALLFPILFLSLPTLYGQKVGAAEIQTFLDRHNYWRAQAGAPALGWSPKLAKHAQQWANQLARRGCNMRHRPNNPYGENLFWGSSYTAYGAADAVDGWAEEKAFYTGQPISRSNFHRIGHYTQMIWSTTTEVGCGVAYCRDGGVLIVCNYDPAGNVLGQRPVR